MKKASLKTANGKVFPLVAVTILGLLGPEHAVTSGCLKNCSGSPVVCDMRQLSDRPQRQVSASWSSYGDVGDLLTLDTLLLEQIGQVTVFSCLSLNIAPYQIFFIIFSL